MECRLDAIKKTLVEAKGAAHEKPVEQIAECKSFTWTEPPSSVVNMVS